VSKELKQLLQGDIAARFDGIESCVLIDYQGLNSEQTQDLRSHLRRVGVRMTVVHNRLVKRVFADREMPDDFREMIRGPTAILVGEDGALSASKNVVDWSKKNKDLAPVKGGLFQGKALSTQDVLELAKLPSKETLQSQGAGYLLAPLTHLASCTQSVLAHFAGCVKARQESAESADNA